jgi:hypothetical protein
MEKHMALISIILIVSFIPAIGIVIVDEIFYIMYKKHKKNN